MYGIFVNEDGGIHYAESIVNGYKMIETRNRNMLRDLVGERVAIVRTRRGKSPMVLGYVDIKFALWFFADQMQHLRDQTLIPPGSKYDATTRGKWCYYLYNPEKCEPYPLPAEAIRHGRSWCEFCKENAK